MDVLNIWLKIIAPIVILVVCYKLIINPNNYKE